MPNSGSKPRLTREEVKFFQREGYLLPRERVYRDDQFLKLKNYFEGLLSALPPDQRPESMDSLHYSDVNLFEWLFADEVLDMVEPILGPDIALFACHFICKPKGDGRRVPWHEDSAYWKNVLNPMEVVTVWLAIDDSTPENGCMHIIPRTHVEGKKGYSDYESVDRTKHVFPIEIVPEQRDDSKCVPCILQAGQCSLHDGRLIHGSAPNHSEKRRCGFTMRFVSTATKLVPGDPEIRQLYLARGRDLANQSYGDPTKANLDVIANRKKKGLKEH